MKYYICIGDKTSKGGSVLEGSTPTMGLSRGLSTIGMKVQCCNAIQTILEGWNGMIIEGKPVAYHGCTISCGCKLIASQNLVGWDDGSSSNTEEQKQDNTEERQIHETPQKYKKRIQLIDSNHQPIIHRKYRLTATDGTTAEGMTDEQGLTEFIWTHAEESVKVEILEDNTPNFDGYHYTDRG
ncbi:PAAR domain-containing protein [Acinetobacter sp. SCC474]|uniref:PAAR domain-containing protein n=1 Tax=Acinetobacter pollinis TaxID=2605270 RepID=UPI0018A26C96|nr:PAAR domain-containing protein [Acinetobacter pollinis]MBF7691658.1 PAAR domain-containing protein [Acinetobacter pollinis]